RRPSYDFGKPARIGKLLVKLTPTVTAGDQHWSMRFKAERGRLT
ncbi:hypothetical protein XPU_4107, partial [Xanthomonas arboricola pv. pruni str. MAFF 311562]